MNLSDKKMLARLGDGENIESLCSAAGITREEFDQWWKQTIESRSSAMDGETSSNVKANVEIQRDENGIPHIFADNDDDLFFGFGYAMAQDRLFQLDYLRRKGLGRLSEILGNDGLAQDTIARTVGLNRIAAEEWKRLTNEGRKLLEAFSRGINTLIEIRGDVLPIEFDLLDYRPERWTPIDSLAIQVEFRWYLTGRFPVLLIPEIAKQALGDGPLYEDFLLGEADEESILKPGEYAVGEHDEMDTVGHVMGDPDEATGSNNWVIGGGQTTTGGPLVGSDPHIAFEAVSCWYEAHLCGGSFHVAGMAYTGIPAIMFGRNEQVAWGITNNICSQRDLYREKVDPDNHGHFIFDGQSEPTRELTEVIQVRDCDPVEKTIRFSRNGPIVNEILPAEAATLGDDPIALRWVGAYEGGSALDGTWLTAMLNMDRARDVTAFREAVRTWHAPTFSMVIADIDGAIGFQSVGRIPCRNKPQRGFRIGWDPDDQWLGVIPFDLMPGVTNPPRGWIASANNRLAPNDFAYPLHGCWSSGWRAIRIREMIESQDKISIEGMRDMHQDTMSLRAADLVPPLVEKLKSNVSPEFADAVSILESWNFRIDADSVATTIFNVFFKRWCEAVAAERFDDRVAALMSTGLAGMAGRLLHSDQNNWFPESDCDQRVVKVFGETLSYLSDRFGDDPEQWQWKNLHLMPLRHVLSTRGDLSVLLDHGGAGVPGDMVTVCNTGSGPDWTAASGAGYRLVADLTSSPPTLMAIDGQSQSGDPASNFYTNQFDDWVNGRYHEIHLDRDFLANSTRQKFVIKPMD